MSVSAGTAWTDEERATWEARLEEGVEHRKHIRAAREELHAIAMRLHQEIVSWERHFDMVVEAVHLRRADVSEPRADAAEIVLVNVEIEAGL